MGTMLQAADLDLDDFEGQEGCNEILNVTRPDVVRGVHDAYLAAGADCVETNTFGANLGNLGEYGITERIRELSAAGARLAREVADGWSTPDRRRLVLGSVGPGTKLPTLGHVPYATLRDAYRENAAGLIDGGADAIIVETTQDLLQTKAAVIGAKRAIAAAGVMVPVIAQVTVETTGTMLLGSEIGAALTALEPLGVDLIGLNCATGPAEMSEHLRYLAQHARIPLSVMPNAGLPELTPDGAVYPLTPDELANANGSKAFREAMLAADFQKCVAIAREQARDGSHLLDLCVDYVGRDGAVDMSELAGRFATASTLPIMLDSTESAVIEAGLERLGGRCVVNSVNFEDGDGPGSRYARVMPIVKEHGAAVVALASDEEGQARTRDWKVRVAARL